LRFNAAGRLWLALLFLGLCSSAFAQETPGEWARRLRQAQTASREEQVETLREFARSEIARSEQSFREELANMLASQDSEEIRDGIEALASVLEVYERAETPIETNANDAASRILSEPQFRKVDEAPSNWLKRALESLERIEPEEREPQSNRFELTRINLEPLFYGIIVALAVGAGVALFFFARGWRSTRATGAAKKKRKVGLLEEGEEALRTDEWLARADELERSGRFREAVRCLYLAVLMRLDDAGLVYFDRYQTNWEHLRRIEASNVPSDVQYRNLTQEFDLIWYGERPTNAEHCATFRREYLRLTEALTGGPATLSHQEKAEVRDPTQGGGSQGSTNG